MAGKKKIIGIICATCIASIFLFKNYYPQFNLSINKFMKVRAADENLNDDKPSDGSHNSNKNKETDDKDTAVSDDDKGMDTDNDFQDSSEVEEKNNKNIHKGNGDQSKIDDNKNKTPTKEFRAAWISTVYNLDWPSKKGLNQSQQKQEFIYLLDKLKKAD